MTKKLIKAVKDPKLAILYILVSCKIFRIIPDDLYLKIIYRLSLGKPLNLKNPKTFSEKIQWLKLHDRNPKYTELVDKYEVRKYVMEKIGGEYLVPLLGVYDNFDDIDFNTLPNKFVLKPNHTSGNIFICNDKTKINIYKLKKEVNRWLKREYYWFYREWPYKNVKPKILCEKYIEPENGESVIDYKFYCFNGNPMYCQVIKDRYVRETIDFFDMEWNLMEFTGLHKPNKLFPHSNVDIKKPKKFEEMKKIAKILAQDIPFVRVDLYYENDKIYFGELTFYPFSGLGEFEPSEWNERLGDLIVLPNLKCK